MRGMKSDGSVRDSNPRPCFLRVVYQPRQPQFFIEAFVYMLQPRENVGRGMPLLTGVFESAC